MQPYGWAALAVIVPLLGVLACSVALVAEVDRLRAEWQRPVQGRLRRRVTRVLGRLVSR